MSKECVFCKVVEGKIPSYTLYEDELVKAFLDVNPVSRGHILVIPKKHFKDIYETPDNFLKRINVINKKMALLCKSKLLATGTNLLSSSGLDAQQTVFHLHFHVIPRYKKDALDFWSTNKNSSPTDIKRVFDVLK